MEDLCIDEGFALGERERVAALYWEAFRRKLRPGFADEPTGLAVMGAALRSDHLLVARQGRHVVGACGFYRDGMGAADRGWSRLRESLSIPAAVRAGLILALLARAGPPEVLVLDGICVDRAARGRGVGTALLKAAANKARRMGARTVRLSVIDANPRARALYERHGYLPLGRGTLGPLAPVFGFDGYTTMEREVGR